MSTANQRIKVAYIAGFGRSGTTLLDNILGQLDGFVSLGELMYVWDRGLIENRLCGCKTPFRDCEFWKAVFETAFGGFDGIDAHAMLELRRRADKPRYDPLLLAGRMGRNHLRRRAGNRADVFERIYRAVVEVTGCTVVVDSSKNPCHAELLNDMRSVDPHIIHLLRDPRAVAYSWRRRKLLEDGGGYFTQTGVVRSSLYWLVEHYTLHRRWHTHAHYRAFRYEDLIAAPRTVLGQILDLLGAAAALPIEGDGRITLKPCHGIGGNSSKFRTGEVILSLDDEWRSKMALPQWGLTTGITAPLLFRYSYPFWGMRGGSAKNARGSG